MILQTIQPKTTIQISSSTRDVLKELGLKGDSYDDILRMLIDDFKKHSPRYTAIKNLKAAIDIGPDD
jgi:hypothetical protein